jgi:hypothetical protein
VGSTNPEELLAAAHAGCFSMSLTHVLTQAGSVPRSVATSARVRLRPVEGVPTIDLVELDTTVDVDGVDADALQKHAEAAEAGCAVSRALTDGCGGDRRGGTPEPGTRTAAWRLYCHEAAVRPPCCDGGGRRSPRYASTGLGSCPEELAAVPG